MKKLTIAGVPEHFNLPWHLCKEKGLFEAKGINLEWTDVPEGTGRLCQMLRDGETDIAVILTEGIIKDITAGNPSKIVQVYVQSPLIWGIHVAAKSSFETVADLENKITAISRYGSGSHLMAFVNAQNEGWDTANLRFEVINTLDGAVEALTNGVADYFMWERFMTKPIVDKGIFRRVGDCPTPWPSFVIAVRNDVLEANSAAIGTVLDIINQMTAGFKEIEGITGILAQRYNQKKEDIAEWLTLTQWSQQNLGEGTLDAIQEQLADLNIINTKVPFENVVG
ncbi:ABC transporter substrate-binding protein [Flavobacterium akiainvivens]|uniref:ABC transporter substrate-binding protein n=1 Tax=Flavobacterium akiainvivens TaxID=1202724 RepID=A0A0M9VH58_9FLAO|nr:substrate-binding domain-containing protein [Flavobacterium akiainvivens]KOS05216.1 ABC transporter substrate-binding protein [Flavobacterium akiainvivens]SFQ50563.1 ABC-type nitrate/sulfonate/bicarbonate transport system, substrate-binding protein [Flavobacterium akiainvivens]